MIITINDKYRITSDERNIIVEESRVSGSTGKRVKNPGEEYWIQISYHPNLEYAIKWFLQREIRLSDALGVYALMDCIKKLETNVLQAVTSLERGQKV